MWSQRFVLLASIFIKIDAAAAAQLRPVAAAVPPLANVLQCPALSVPLTLQRWRHNMRWCTLRLVSAARPAWSRRASSVRGPAFRARGPASGAGGPTSSSHSLAFRARCPGLVSSARPGVTASSACSNASSAGGPTSSAYRPALCARCQASGAHCRAALHQARAALIL